MPFESDDDHRGLFITIDDQFIFFVPYLKSLEVKTEKSWGVGRMLLEIFEETVEENLINPTFVTEYPVEVSPLSRRNSENPDFTDRFELFIGGKELANGFCELNDPDDQAERFREQVKAKDTGDKEAMSFDEDYVIALEHGMPPAVGVGIGIDRLVMMITNQTSIRDPSKIKRTSTICQAKSSTVINAAICTFQTNNNKVPNHSAKTERFKPKFADGPNNF